MTDSAQVPIESTANTTLYFTNLPPPVVGLHNTGYGQSLYDIAYEHSPKKNPKAVQRYMKALVKVNALTLRKMGINTARPNIHKILPFKSLVLPNPGQISEGTYRAASEHANYVNRLPFADRQKLHQMINQGIDINTYNSAALLAMSIQSKTQTNETENNSIFSMIERFAFTFGDELAEVIEKRTDQLLETIEKTESALQRYVDAVDMTAKAVARRDFVNDFKELNLQYNRAVNELNHLQLGIKKAGYYQNAKTMAQAKRGTKIMLTDLKAFYHSSQVLKYTKIIGRVTGIGELVVIGNNTYKAYEANGDWQSVLIDGLAEVGGAKLGGDIVVIGVSAVIDLPVIVLASLATAGAYVFSSITEWLAEKILKDRNANTG